MEFGAKLDLSIDENGMARLEKLSFDAYNESDVLGGAIERYREPTQWSYNLQPDVRKYLNKAIRRGKIKAILSLIRQMP